MQWIRIERLSLATVFFLLLTMRSVFAVALFSAIGAVSAGSLKYNIPEHVGPENLHAYTNEALTDKVCVGL